MTLLDDKVKVVIQFNWEPLMKQLAYMFEQIRESFRRAFPFLSSAYQAHRAEVKRVHTAYGRKRKARARRRRKR